MNKMNKIAAFLTAAFAGSVALADGTPVLNTTELETQITQLKTDITTLLTGPIMTAVLAVAAAGLLIWLGIRAYKWFKKA